ncbi:unnamed protein product [Arctogadus glacialis]
MPVSSVQEIKSIQVVLVSSNSNMESSNPVHAGTVSVELTKGYYVNNNKRFHFNILSFPVEWDRNRDNRKHPWRISIHLISQSSQPVLLSRTRLLPVKQPGVEPRRPADRNITPWLHLSTVSNRVFTVTWGNLASVTRVAGVPGEGVHLSRPLQPAEALFCGERERCRVAHPRQTYVLDAVFFLQMKGRKANREPCPVCDKARPLRGFLTIDG